jgi:hypothetical protein
MPNRRCVICGCDFDRPQAKRRRRHEPPITSVKVQTCSRTCEEKRQRRRVIRPESYWLRRYRRLRLPRERAWRCRECGCSFEVARTKRRRRGEQEIQSPEPASLAPASHARLTGGADDAAISAVQEIARNVGACIQEPRPLWRRRAVLHRWRGADARSRHTRPKRATGDPAASAVALRREVPADRPGRHHFTNPPRGRRARPHRRWRTDARSSDTRPAAAYGVTGTAVWFL